MRCTAWLLGCLLGVACRGPAREPEPGAFQFPRGGRVLVLDRIRGQDSDTRMLAPAAVNEVPAGHRVSPLVLLDLRAEAEPGNAVTLGHVEDWELRHGTIPAGAVVVAYWGWRARLDREELFEARDADGEARFPGFEPAAARRLVAGLGVRALATDGPGIGRGEQGTAEVRRIVTEAGGYVVENLDRLDGLPPRGAVLIVSPLGAPGASVAPARVLAIAERRVARG